MIALHKDVDALSRADRLAGLYRIIPRHRVDQVLARTGKSNHFCKRLPAGFVLWFVLALGLFCRDCYRQVFRWMRPWKSAAVPGRSTLCEARRRLGVAPLVLLARQTVKLLARPDTPGAFYRGMRLMAPDAFVVDIPDMPENERVFGRPPGDRAPGAFPQARVAALCEAGTHVMYPWLIKPIRWDEKTMANGLLKFLEPDMLLMWDRNFLSYERVRRVVKQGTRLLVRIAGNLIFRPIQRFGDGSFLAKLYRNPADREHDRKGIPVRIIEYTFDDPRRPGAGEKHRLLTTLLDDGLDPAITLIQMYHERWEEELSIDEMKTHEMERPVLRSQTPAGVVQELYSLLPDHFIVRVLMFEAAMKQGMDPRRMSFTGTLKILRRRIPGCPGDLPGQRHWWADLLSEVAEEVLPPRRNRINPRVIKKTHTKWPKKRPRHRPYPQPTKTFRESIVVLN